MEPLGPILKALRKQAGLTQAQVAEKAGITRTTVTNIELGNQGITADTLRAIAKALGYEARITFKRI